jgi:hypothetical protein
MEAIKEEPVVVQAITIEAESTASGLQRDLDADCAAARVDGEVSSDVSVPTMPHVPNRNRQMQRWAQSWSEQLRRDALVVGAASSAVRLKTMRAGSAPVINGKS